MNNITEKGGVRFIKGEGLNMFPSVAVLSCKLFYKDKSEGSEAGIVDKIKAGDDLIYNKAMKDYRSALIDKRDDIIANTVAFHDDDINDNVSIIKLTYENGNYYKIKSDRIEMGSNLGDTKIIFDSSSPIEFTISHVKQIWKRANDYVVATSEGIYVPVLVGASTVYKSVYDDGSDNNEYFFNGKRIFIAMNGGIRYSDELTLDAIASGFDFDWDRAEYRSTSVTDGNNNTTILTNGLDPSDTYIGIVADATSVYAYSPSGLYTCNINTLVSGHNGFIPIATKTGEIFKSISVGEAGAILVNTSSGVFDVTNRVTVIAPSAKSSTKINSVYVVLCGDTSIYVKSAGNSMSIKLLNSGISKPANFMISYTKDNKDYISAIGSSSVSSSYDASNNTSFLAYPVYYIHKTDYEKETQVTKMMKYNIAQFYAMLYDQNSTFYNNLAYIDGQATNFVFVEIKKSGTDNRKWYMCGDDNRSETEYAEVCTEFGIE